MSTHEVHQRLCQEPGREAASLPGKARYILGDAWTDSGSSPGLPHLLAQTP